MLHVYVLFFYLVCMVATWKEKKRHKEVPSFIPASNSRPADIFLPHWSHEGCSAAPKC